MTIEIKDEVLDREIKKCVNDIAQKKISEYVKACDVQSVANRLMQTRFNSACNNILQSGSFYDKVAEHIAIRMAGQIADEIKNKINIDKIYELVACKIAKSVIDKMK